MYRGALAVLLLGAVSISNAALLGSKECTYGPAYWCGSLRNSKQCSATTHCIQSVWLNQVLPEDNDEICNVCKDMVQQARDTLESQQTKDEVIQIVDNSCRAIPLPDIAKECIGMADEMVPEFIEMLASRMNPQVVCATAGLCNSVRIDRMLRDAGMLVAKPKEQVAVAAAADRDCKDCNNFVSDVIDEVRQHSKTELMDRLLQICGELGSVSDGCQGLVSVNINFIYNFLATKIDPGQVCDLFGMCGDLFGGVAEAKKAVAKTGDAPCDMCVVVAEHWKDVLTTNTTQAEFIEVLEGLCHQSGSFKDECIGLVDNYGRQAYDWLMNEFDPKQVCEIVGVCGTNNRHKAVWTSLHVGPSPDAVLGEQLPIDSSSLTFVGRDEANSYHAPRLALTPSIKISVAGESGRLPSDSQACTMCQFTLHFIQIQLQDNKTKEAIENAVRTVCNRLPGDVREECDDYVDAYGDQAIALLQQEIDPSVLCPMLGLCPGVHAAPSLASQSSPSHPTADVTCVTCEFVMVKVKDLLGNKTNQVAVQTALDQVCSALPHVIYSDCRNFVDSNAVELMQLIAAGVQPEHVCRMLGLCDPSKAALPPLDASHQLPVSRLFLHTPSGKQLEQTGQSKVCVVCEFTLNILEKIILDNNTQVVERVEEYVERTCLLLPNTLQEDCLGFIEQYGRAVAELIVNDVKPGVVCRGLTLCTAPNFAGLGMGIMRRSRRSTLDFERRCLVCKAVATTHKAVKKGGPVTSVADFCLKLKNDEREVCSAVDIAALETELNKSRATTTGACSSLGYCPAPSHLIGGEKCTWGPSYWCQSLLHAQSCGATPHCEKRVWV